MILHKYGYWQSLVEAMETKLVDVDGRHREEATELVEKRRQVEKQLEGVREERASLLEINTFLSGQVGYILSLP